MFDLHRAPAELRNRIYELIVVENTELNIKWKKPPITQVCRQIRNECLPNHLAHNNFYASIQYEDTTGVVLWLKTLGRDHLQHMKKLTIDFKWFHELYSTDEGNIKITVESNKWQSWHHLVHALSTLNINSSRLSWPGPTTDPEDGGAFVWAARCCGDLRKMLTALAPKSVAARTVRWALEDVESLCIQLQNQEGGNEDPQNAYTEYMKRFPHGEKAARNGSRLQAAMEAAMEAWFCWSEDHGEHVLETGTMLRSIYNDSVEKHRRHHSHKAHAERSPDTFQMRLPAWRGKDYVRTLEQTAADNIGALVRERRVTTKGPLSGGRGTVSDVKNVPNFQQFPNMFGSNTRNDTFAVITAPSTFPSFTTARSRPTAYGIGLRGTSRPDLAKLSELRPVTSEKSSSGSTATPTGWGDNSHQLFNLSRDRTTKKGALNIRYPLIQSSAPAPQTSISKADAKHIHQGATLALKPNPSPFAALAASSVPMTAGTKSVHTAPMEANGAKRKADEAHLDPEYDPKLHDIRECKKARFQNSETSSVKIPRAADDPQ